MRRRILFLGIFLTAIIFAADILLPSRLHLEFLYPVVILLSIWTGGNRSTFDAGIVMTGLIAAGFYINDHSAMGDNELSSIAIPAACIWAFVYVIILFKNEQEKSRKSDEHLNAMFANATEGIVISNLKGEIVMANPHSERMFGYEKGALLSATIEDLVPNRFAHRHTANRNKYYGEMKTRPMGRGMTLFAKRKDGSEFPVEISLSNFKIKEDSFIISFIIDITDRKQQEDLVTKANEELELRVDQRTRELAEAIASLKAEVDERSRMEEALRDSERLYSTMAHNFPNGWIEILDRNLRRVFFDGKELQELGIRREEFLGKTKFEKMLLPISDEVKQKLQKVFEWESSNLDIEYEGRIYEVNAVPLPDIKGFVKEILLVIQNVTEVRKAEVEIRESLNKEKQLNELKSKFVSLASHEFRTPLSTILSSASLAEKYSRPEDEEKRKKHFDRIKSSVKNLTEILNDFLSLEKLEAGKLEVRPSQFDIVHFAEDLKEEMQTLTKPGQQIIYRHIGEQKEITLDKQLLRNICINLLNNAIKYSHEEKTIEFTTDVNAEIKISVKDHGIGIPKEDQQHLFERFFRAQNVTAIQGTGLGLNIVNRYIKLLNGRLEYKSEENHGSEFTLHFSLVTDNSKNS
jgi:PAS domain S-box-containing protein